MLICLIEQFAQMSGLIGNRGLLRLAGRTVRTMRRPQRDKKQHHCDQASCVAMAHGKFNIISY
jgi:hypothetical protein